MSGGSRREGDGLRRLAHTHRPQAISRSSPPVAPLRARVASRVGAAPHAHMNAAREPRTQLADPMDDILPVMDGLDADFPDVLAEATRPGASRKVSHRHRHHDAEAEGDIYEDDADLDSVEAHPEAQPSRIDADADEELEAPYEVDGEDDEDTPAAAHEGDALVETDAAIEVGEDTASANMEEAYRFLLHHIDAEMTAIQRRQEDVKQRRQNREVHYRHTVKELFTMMESPWLLIPDDVGMPLPVTGMDVYVKEELKKRHTKAADHRPAEDAQNKMLHLALEKNYRSFPAARKQPYEAAAKHNELRRHELKSRLHKGCSKFEAYLADVKECTADMVRRGDVSAELPTAGLHQVHSHLPRAQRRGRSPPGDKSASVSDSAEETARGSRGSGSPSASASSSNPRANATAQPGNGSARKRVKHNARSRPSKAPTQAATTSASSPSPSTSRAKPKTPAKKNAGAAASSRRGQAKKSRVSTKKAASAPRGGPRASGKSASIPLPTIHGLLTKKKPAKPSAGAKAKKAGRATHTKPKNKKKK